MSIFATPFFFQREEATFFAQAVQINGSNLEVASTLANPGANSRFMLSFWFKPGTSGGNQRLIAGTQPGDYFVIENGTGGFIVVDLYATNGSTRRLRYVVQTSLALGSWHHIITACDTQTANKSAYIDGVSAVCTITHSNAGDLAWATPGRWTLFDSVSGCVAEVWMHNQYYSDGVLTSSDVLNFRSAAGKPVAMGAQGSAAGIATQPYFYFKNSAATWGTNTGMAGNLIIINTPVNCANSPST